MSDVIIAKAAVLHRAASPLSVEFVRVLPPRRGEVRVRLKTAGVCHSDLHVIKGDLAMPMPVICGHEGAGVIESVGEGVASVLPGDRVIPIWRASCGQCGYCLAGRPALCDMGTRMRFEGVMPDGTTRFESAAGKPIHHYAGVSTFAAVSTMPEAAVVKIPGDYDSTKKGGTCVVAGITTVAKDSGSLMTCSRKLNAPPPNMS